MNIFCNLVALYDTYEHYETSRKQSQAYSLNSQPGVYSGSGTILCPSGNPTQDNHSCRHHRHCIHVAMPMADDSGAAVLRPGRLLRIVRQLHRTDGIFRDCPYLVHRIFHRQIFQESGARQEAHSQGQRLPRHRDLLHTGVSSHSVLQDRSRSRTIHHTDRSMHLRLPHRRNDAHRPAPAKQSLRSWSRAVCVLGLHTGLEHVRRTNSIWKLSDNRSLLRGTVASFHPRHTVPHSSGNASDKVLTNNKGLSLRQSLVCLYITQTRVPMRELKRRGWQRQTP